MVPCVVSLSVSGFIQGMPSLGNVTQCGVGIAFWNIDGLYAREGNQRLCKLNDGEVVDLVSRYDIVGFAETHVGPHEVLTLNGYYMYQQHRPNPKMQQSSRAGLPYAYETPSVRALKFCQPLARNMYG